MADKQKNKKQGRQKKSAQNIRYINEKRREQNKLANLKRHIAAHGVTAEVRDTYRLLQIALGIPPADLKIDKPQDRSPASAAFHRRPDANTIRKQMRAASLAA